jgi:hypothetical protein
LVETLLLERLQQLRNESSHDGEHEAISEALSTLHAIQRDKLGFPDWK